MIDLIRKELSESAEVLDRFLRSDDTLQEIASAAELIANSFSSNAHVYSCGNGGSMCDAMHFAEELSGRFRNDRKSLPAQAISDSSHLTCVANDYGFDQVFARYIDAFGRKGDILFAISTSGNSENVVKAAEMARSKGMYIIALTGKDGGKLKDLADIEIRVEHHGFADRIQEIHIKVIHCLILSVENILFAKS